MSSSCVISALFNFFSFFPPFLESSLLCVNWNSPIRSNPIECALTGAGSPLCPHRTQIRITYKLITYKWPSHFSYVQYCSYKIVTEYTRWIQILWTKIKTSKLYLSQLLCIHLTYLTVAVRLTVVIFQTPLFFATCPSVSGRAFSVAPTERKPNRTSVATSGGRRRFKFGAMPSTGLGSPYTCPPGVTASTALCSRDTTQCNILSLDDDSRHVIWAPLAASRPPLRVPS